MSESGLSQLGELRDNIRSRRLNRAAKRATIDTAQFLGLITAGAGLATGVVYNDKVTATSILRNISHFVKLLFSNPEYTLYTVPAAACLSFLRHMSRQTNPPELTLPISVDFEWQIWSEGSTWPRQPPSGSHRGSMPTANNRLFMPDGKHNDPLNRLSTGMTPQPRISPYLLTDRPSPQSITRYAKLRMPPF